jgi:cytohesin
MTALAWAAGCGHVEAVRALLRAGADPDARSGNGDPPICHAARQPGPIVWMLLDAGADPDARAPDAPSALHIACLMSNADAVDALFEAGADPGGVFDHLSPPLGP